MTPPRQDILLPDLGMGHEPILVSLWLVDEGETVVEGDRVIEVLAGNATVDVSASATGTLAEQCVQTDEQAYVGQVLGRIEPE